MQTDLVSLDAGIPELGRWEANAGVKSRWAPVKVAELWVHGDTGKEGMEAGRIPSWVGRSVWKYWPA